MVCSDVTAAAENTAKPAVLMKQPPCDQKQNTDRSEQQQQHSSTQTQAYLQELKNKGKLPDSALAVIFHRTHPNPETGKPEPVELNGVALLHQKSSAEDDKSTVTPVVGSRTLKRKLIIRSRLKSAKKTRVQTAPQKSMKVVDSNQTAENNSQAEPECYNQSVACEIQDVETAELSTAEDTGRDTGDKSNSYVCAVPIKKESQVSATDTMMEVSSVSADKSNQSTNPAKTLSTKKTRRRKQSNPVKIKTRSIHTQCSMDIGSPHVYMKHDEKGGAGVINKSELLRTEMIKRVVNQTQPQVIKTLHQEVKKCKIVVKKSAPARRYMMVPVRCEPGRQPKIINTAIELKKDMLLDTTVLDSFAKKTMRSLPPKPVTTVRLSPSGTHNAAKRIAPTPRIEEDTSSVTKSKAQKVMGSEICTRALRRQPKNGKQLSVSSQSIDIEDSAKSSDLLLPRVDPAMLQSTKDFSKDEAGKRRSVKHEEVAERADIEVAGSDKDSGKTVEISSGNITTSDGPVQICPKVDHKGDIVYTLIPPDKQNNLPYRSVNTNQTRTTVTKDQLPS